MKADQLGKNLQMLRKAKGFSQEDIAKFLEVSRTAIVQLEKGRRQVSAIELGKLSAILDFSLDQILSTPYEKESSQLIAEEPRQSNRVPAMRESEPILKRRKLENLILYISGKAGALPRMEVNVLATLLYFCDFGHYERHEEHLTGLSYTMYARGPYPDSLPEVLESMEEASLLLKVKSVYASIPHLKYLPLAHADLTKMNAAEKQLVDEVLGHFAHWPAKALQQLASDEMPCKATGLGKTISYELAFYRRLPHSTRIYDDDWYGMK